MQTCARWTSKLLKSHRLCLSRALYSTQTETLLNDFVFFHNFLSVPEQRILLAAALDNLDQRESSRFRRRRRPFGSRVSQLTNIGSVSSLFLPDEYYDFEEVSKCTILWG